MRISHAACWGSVSMDFISCRLELLLRSFRFCFKHFLAEGDAAAAADSVLLLLLLLQMMMMELLLPQLLLVPKVENSVSRTRRIERTSERASRLGSVRATAWLACSPLAFLALCGGRGGGGGGGGESVGLGRCCGE
ncbi:unnamed protein product [Lampetra planeri]